MHAKLKVLFSLLFCSIWLHAQNKIIYLIAPPRTLSTVFLRFMHARGDMIVYNEPSQYAFLYALSGGGVPDDYNTDIPFKTYAEIKNRLLQDRQYSMVLVKDPSLAAFECLYNDDAFLTDPDIEFCFIIRNPHAAIISYYNALGLRHPDPNGFAWRVERKIYEVQYALYKKIAQLRNKASVVISCEELAANPEKVLPAFCAAVGIDFNTSMLTWPSLLDSFDPLDWNEYKTLQMCKRWHKDALVSTHFKPLIRNYAVDQYGKPTFAEFEAQYKAILTDMYEHYLRFYTKMHMHRIRY